MIGTLIWLLIGTFFIVAAIPFLAILAPAVYMLRCAARAELDNEAVGGLFWGTLIYSILIWHFVHGTWLLALLLIAVPFVIGRLLAFAH